MPQFNTPGTLQVTYDSGTFGSTSFSFVSMTLLETTPAASQIEVRYDVITYQPYQGGPSLNVAGEISGLSNASLETMQNLSNSNVVFVNAAEIVFNEANSTVEVPVPLYATVPAYEYNGTTYTRVYYDTTNSGPSIAAATPIVLRRSTNVTAATTTFQPGSRLTADMLNTARNQNLFAIQELTEFGALAGEEGGGGGGGSFNGDLWDISGAQQLNAAADGNVIWSGDNLVSTTDSQGIMPYTDSITASGYVLLSDMLATNATKTSWTPLNSNVVDVNGVSLSSVLTILDGKAAYFEDTANGLVVNGGDAGTVDVESTNIILDGLVDITGDVTLVTINGAAPVTATSSIDELADVDTTGAVSGQALLYDGAEWKPSGMAKDTDLEFVDFSWGTDAVTLVAGQSCSMFNSDNFPNNNGSNKSGPLSSDINFATSGEGFVAPRDGTYSFTMTWMVSPSVVASGVVKTYGDYTVNSVADGSSLYNYLEANDIDTYSPSTHEMVMTLSAGDVVNYRISNAAGGVSARLYYAFFNAIEMTIDATIVANQIINADIVNAPNGNLDVEQRVGIDNLGKPLYCQTRQWTGSFNSNGTKTLWAGFFDGNRQMALTEPVELFNAGVPRLYLSADIFAQYGLQNFQDGTNLNVFRNNSAAILAAVPTGSYGTYNIFYTKDSDVAEETMTVIPTNTQDSYAAYVTLTPNAYQTSSGSNAVVVANAGQGSGNVNIFRYSTVTDRFSGMASLSLAHTVGTIAYDPSNTSIIDCFDNRGENFFSLATSSNGVALFKKPGLYSVSLSGIFNSPTNATQGNGGFRVFKDGVGGTFTQNAISNLPVDSSEYITQTFLIPVTASDVANAAEFSFLITANAPNSGSVYVNASRVQLTLNYVGSV